MDSDPLRVYADTSVFGGVFDEEFDTPSTAFFEQVRQGRFQLVVSAVVQGEIETAPEAIQTLFNDLLPLAEIAAVDEQCCTFSALILQLALSVRAGQPTRSTLP